MPDTTKVRKTKTGDKPLADTGGIIEPPPTAIPSVVAGDVTALRYILVNEKGERCGMFGFGDNGAPGLVLFEPGADEPRIEITVSPEGPKIEVYRRDSGEAAFLSLEDKSGLVGLVLTDKTGKPLLAFISHSNKTQAGVAMGSDFYPIRFCAEASKKNEPPEWARANRAARRNDRKAFTREVLACGFGPWALDTLWTMMQDNARRRSRAPRKARR